MKRFLLWLSLLPVFLFGSSCDSNAEEYKVVDKKYILADTSVVLEFKEDGFVYFADDDNPWRKYEQEDDILKFAELNKDYYSEYYFIYNGKLIKIERYYTEVPEPEESDNDKKD